MKEVYVLRHAEKDDAGVVTEQGKRLAKELGSRLPHFAKVLSSESPRTKETALLLTGEEPNVEERAGFYGTVQEISDAVFKLASEQGITFLEAAETYNGGELRPGIESKANDLNQLIDEVLAQLDEDEKGLIVSHDMTIVPAMASRGQARESISYLSGYIICADNSVTKFSSGV